jgi:predicted cupin superfamily sugar epimerase
MAKTPVTAKEWIKALNLQRHPEGGWFAETFRDSPDGVGRAHSTAIYFLLEAGEASHWHKVDAAELWLFHAGAPLELKVSVDGLKFERKLVGLDLSDGQQPQGLVPANAWQAAKTLGDYTLVSCTVAPGFEFSRFTLAPKDWSPGRV